MADFYVGYNGFFLKRSNTFLVNYIIDWPISFEYRIAALPGSEISAGHSALWASVMEFYILCEFSNALLS